MAMNYEYAYALIDPNTKMCLGVITSNDDSIGGNYVRIPVADPAYGFKFYIDGEWYEDAAGTIPWTSSML